MGFELGMLLYKLAPSMLVGVLLAPLVLYAVAKWRATREPTPDPQLGFKFVLYYFATVAFQLALAGGMLLIYAMIKPSSESMWPDGEAKGGLYRMAFGLIVPAGLVLGAHVLLIVRTNDAQHPGVRKLFVALNLMISGVLGLGALVLGFQALFARGSTNGLGHAGGAAILVYCTAWVLLAWRYHQLVIGGSVFGDAQAMPDVVLPAASGSPASPASPEPPAAGGGLPALGGGSFPPIDQPK